MRYPYWISYCKVLEKERKKRLFGNSELGIAQSTTRFEGGAGSRSARLNRLRVQIQNETRPNLETTLYYLH